MLELGSVYSDDNKYEMAVEQFTEAIRLDHPQRAEVYRQRAEAYSRLREYQLAVQDYDEFIRLAPQDGEVYIERGLVYARLRKPDRAIQDFTEAIRLDPEGTERLKGWLKVDLSGAQGALAYRYRGNAYFSLGEYEQAIQDYEKAINLAPPNAFARHDRDRAYQGPGVPAPHLPHLR